MKFVKHTMTVRKVLMITTLVSIIPALAIIVGTGIEHGRSLEYAVRAEARRQVEAIAAIQNSSTETLRQLLDTVANLSAFQDGRVDEEEEVLSVLLARNPRLLNLTVTDAEGRVVVSPGLAPGTDLSDRSHVRQALETGEFSVGEYILARIDGSPAFPFSIPIKNDADIIIGTLNVVYPLDSYGELFSRLDLPDDTILGILDRNGVRLFFRPIKETNPIGVPIKDDVWNAMVQGQESGTIHSRGSDGVARFYAYRRLSIGSPEVPYLYIVVGFPEQSATEPARQVLVRNVFFMVGVIALAVITAIVLGGAVFTRRIQRLAATAREISGGNFSARTGLGGSVSEIEIVAHAIDEMALRLDERSTERAREEARLLQSLKEKEVLLKEIHHRVKNNMQLILSIVHLQRDSTDDIDAFCRDLEMRIGAIAGVHEMLYQSDNLSTIEMQSFFVGLTEIVTHAPVPPHISVNADGVMLRIERAVPVALIASELLVNATKHATRDGGPCAIGLDLRTEAGRLILEVADDGPGFPDGFDPAKSEGLGMRLVHALADQLTGIVKIWTDGGAHIRVEMQRSDKNGQ